VHGIEQHQRIPTDEAVVDAEGRGGELATAEDLERAEHPPLRLQHHSTPLFI
jgi:hypothetical protein